MRISDWSSDVCSSDLGAKLNYGVNKVRFPNPLLVGKRIRLNVAIADVVDIPKGKQLTVRHTVEIEDEEKPACVAETVVLLLPWECFPETAALSLLPRDSRDRQSTRLKSSH